MNLTDEFRHERLKLYGNFMRLLQIQGGTKKDVISLRITQYAIHRRPPYAAISYTWGPNPHANNVRHHHHQHQTGKANAQAAAVETYTRQIRVNGRPFRVRVNLWNLLYHLRQRGESRFLWVDALCIDQENLEERNFHVQRMSEIYEKAVLTFVWLGLPSEDRRQARALEFISEMATFCRKHHHHHQHQPDLSSSAFRAKYLVEAYAHRWANLLELCRGNYWTRTWIIQEFVRASKVQVLCGTASLDWIDFEDIVRAVRSIISSPSSTTAPSLTCSPAMPAFVQQFTQTIPFRLTSRRASHTASTLEDLLLEFYDSKCAERRDKVYGILGIADDCGEDPEGPPGSYRGPQPDYSKHILEVHFEVFSYLMQPSLATPRSRSPMQAIFLAQRALGITQADVESYMALQAIQKPGNGQGVSLLTGRLRDFTYPLVPDYVNFIDEVLPGWTSIRDLRQRLEQVDWAKYVGHEVRKRSSTRPSAGGTQKSSSSTTSVTSTTSSSTAGTGTPTATGAGTGTAYIRAPLPPDMIENVVHAASHSEEISHLYNYSPPPPSSTSSSASSNTPTAAAAPPPMTGPGNGATNSHPLPIPIPHMLKHPHDKRLHNNPSLLKPRVIIETNPPRAIEPTRIGFACTDARPGDLLCQFSGLDVTLIARRRGSGNELALVGLGKMCTHQGLKERSVHPACRTGDAGQGKWSGVPLQVVAAGGVQHGDQGDRTGMAILAGGNPDGWSIMVDPIGLWEVLRRS
ncbi:uncharacterized protein Z520_03450 [Fonsecaea multimorphosa CBS 102226]|uniref:Heterokaryon incompatibility domain-containing protein n=1 Tax=Fonsecaea multimorphosa CBS 102226 TaxID=1442371 RepID=A0A0D2KCD0_9EURO|nr:uncharacterized protein Z520_03450 [Fonsecaea multimorphosa CBS 102226]KIY00785.1 hypothetical protein Z520_03450 [Fonsecaea multimorphosa CBS 102226]OAL27884.1 hypothetical protein AYO22_03229 [Fonsecaea multimorphosa]